MIEHSSSSSGRRFLVYCSTAVALLAGCSYVPSLSHQVIEVKSCVDDALAVQYELIFSNAMVSGLTLTSTSSNVVGTPSITPLGPNSFEITAELAGVLNGDPVTFTFAASVQQYGFGQASNVRFYTDPPDSLGDPACIPMQGLRFATSLDPLHGLVLEVSNPSPVPIELMTLQLAASPVFLAPAQLHRADPDFNALPWQTALTGTVLAPGAPALTVDLPETAPSGTAAVVSQCEYKVAGGEPMLTINEIDLQRPISVRTSTWSEVKVLSR